MDKDKTKKRFEGYYPLVDKLMGIIYVAICSGLAFIFFPSMYALFGTRWDEYWTGIATMYRNIIR